MKQQPNIDKIGKERSEKIFPKIVLDLQSNKTDLKEENETDSKSAMTK